jgi:triphosphoribosyl-dephospho-CoA synthase
MFEGQTFAQVQRQVRHRVDAVRVACELEVSAPKLGNVHPNASFSDCDDVTFMRAAAQISPVLGSLDRSLALGDRVLRSVERTRLVTEANVNLGIILLVAPLAMADDRQGVASVIRALSPADGSKVFQAIRLASPGGMKREEVPPDQDVLAVQDAPIDLVDAMAQAADRDRIALQYASNFDDFFDHVLPIVASHLTQSLPVQDAIVNAQLDLMSREVDSLILRKCGPEIAEEARARAEACLTNDSVEQRQQFDAWLRADGNRRNPGTTADLLAASIYWLIISPWYTKLTRS